ncbi:MAG TPA: hypothetical protein VFV01_04410 [Spirillospora sp.]|nr:hypothetical protein [Spirillospora sp.]
MTETQSGAPPTKETRRSEEPGSTRITGNASVTDQSDTLRALVEKAAALIAAIGDQAARDTESWNAGYREAMTFCRAMFDHGVDVGRAAAEQDMADAWSALARKVRGMANQPRFRELEDRRYPDRTHKELLIMRGRDRYPLPDRQCHVCGGRIPGGVE